MVNIFEPKKSKLESGLKSKTILIYGSNRTGKTKNLSQSEKPLFLAFEYGLEAIDGINYFPINKWRDFQDYVKQLTDINNEAKAHEMYQTIVIDTADALCRLASNYICNLYGISSIGEDSSGKKGWGRWTELRNEIFKQITLLTNAGFTVAFIAHDTPRIMTKDNGETYEKIYPSGDNKAMSFICDLCGIIGYVCSDYNSDENNNGLSTLYLKDTAAFKAGTRYDFLPASIPAWSLAKLESALNEAIKKQEARDHVKSVEASVIAEEAKIAKKEEEAAKLPIEELINQIGNKIEKMIEKDGNMEAYSRILSDDLGFADFKAQEATEKQREQLEQIIDLLTKKGY